MADRDESAAIEGHDAGVEAGEGLRFVGRQHDGGAAADGGGFSCTCKTGYSGATCETAAGPCVADPSVCDDNSLCTDDSCETSDGTCLNLPVDCDDVDACTEDTCDGRRTAA